MAELTGRAGVDPGPWTLGELAEIATGRVKQQAEFWAAVLGDGDAKRPKVITGPAADAAWSMVADRLNRKKGS